VFLFPHAHPRACTAGYSIDPPAFQALFRSFDSDSDRRLGLPEFIALHLFMRRYRMRMLSQARRHVSKACSGLAFVRQVLLSCLAPLHAVE